ncbi:hypothetical protein ACTMTJ_44320 [Phytohabitans sp. LJ34]|uniref:hypothetical protein n=1 Tax=Phytohabitans sp. LJ34 TaxID=3452217 RepID=UPI003F88C5CA
MNRPSTRGRPWAPTDRTGGPLDDVFDLVRQHVPSFTIERLTATHPADDDNVYYLGDHAGPDQVQVDSADHGQPPFHIEANERLSTSDPTKAADTIRAWLTKHQHPTSL